MDIKKRVLRFKQAMDGIISAWHSGVHFRIQFFAAIIVIVMAWLTKVNPVEWAILLVCVALVLGSEMFNSAIEQLSDLYTLEENVHIRIVKDISAGAVLISAFIASIVALIIFTSHWMNFSNP